MSAPYADHSQVQSDNEYSTVTRLNDEYDDKQLHLGDDHDHDKVNGPISTYHKEAEATYQPVAPEVHAVVPSVDDPDESCETFRSYLLGTIAAVVGTGLNTWVS